MDFLWGFYRHGGHFSKLRLRHSRFAIVLGISVSLSSGRKPTCNITRAAVAPLQQGHSSHRYFSRKTLNSRRFSRFPWDCRALLVI